jgi:hypothetical protein
MSNWMRWARNEDEEEDENEGFKKEDGPEYRQFPALGG